VKLALRALLVVVIAVVGMQTGAAAQSSSPLVTVPNSIVFWNAHDGLLAVEQCPRPELRPCNRSAVELTTDGGRSYRVVLRARGSLELQTLGAGGALASMVTGKTWRTLDRGRTWRRAPSMPSADWLNPRIGVRFRSYTAHDRGALAMLVTRDGGRTWQRQQRDPCNKTDATFGAFADLVRPKVWWLACVGEGGAGNEDKAIYRTQNGGTTWEAGAATVFVANHEREHGGISSYGYPGGLAFAPAGWGLLTESRGTLYVTRDGGIRFRAEPHVARPETDFAAGAAAFDGGLGYVLLTDYRGARLIETRNFGRTWDVVRRWRS
jgi:photosystem II stability/assembly factor-like uncharacterized protein